MSKKVSVFRKEHFNAAHKLNCLQWSDAQNEKEFGKCANPNWHGHNYDLFVTVKGEPQPETGFCIDLKYLSDIIEERVTDKLDHKNLNIDVDFMQGKMASCEVLVMEFWKILAPAVKEITPRGSLYKLTLYETPRNFVEYVGE